MKRFRGGYARIFCVPPTLWTCRVSNDALGVFMTSSRTTARIGTLLSVVLLALLSTSTNACAQMTGFFTATPEDGPCSLPPAAPHFSIKSGNYSTPVELRLTDHSRGAVIFYTTDGWTPTSNSTRYMGPISIDKSTTVQAIALVANCSMSRVATATFALPSAEQPAPDAELLPVLPGANGALALRSDARIPLIFASSIDSRTAQVGDSIALTLAADLKIGDKLLASKGTPATGRVIQVDLSGVGDAPGEIQFEVESLNLNGTKIPLHAVDALAGRYAARASTTAIGAATTAGISLLFEHGKDARIPAGAPLTATMAAGTVLTSPENTVASSAGSGTL